MRKLLAILIALSPITCSIVASQNIGILPASGVYKNTFNVSINASEGYTVHYTFNGNIPTANDAVYNGPIALSDDCFSHSNIFHIQNCPDVNWYDCDDVDHIIVLRAALFDNNGVRQSQTATSVYVINRLLDRKIELPIVSLCIDSTDLFDFDSGIFIPGRFYDNNNVYHSGNYCQKGREWERLADFKYIENNDVKISQTCGIRIHGNRTRSYVQKGFTLYAREEYGKKNFKHNFFGDNNISKFKRLVLRPWMASWTGAGIEDWTCQQMASTLLCDHLATRPVVLFLNGEYWGIYFLEEKPDEHYVEDHYGYDDESVNILADWGREVENGSANEWNALYAWLENADLSREDDYNYFATQVDIDALLDYMLLQVFITNVDWPANNVRQWSFGGSPWRWFFFDGDAALVNWRENQEILNYLTCDDPAQTYPSAPYATLLFRRLLANENFRKYSIDRFYKNIYYRIGDIHINPLVDDMGDLLSNEVKYQSQRFGSPVSVSKWKYNIKEIKKYIASRSKTMIEDYAKHIGLDPNNIETFIFPNPSHGTTTLHYKTDCGGVIDISIYSSHGSIVWRQTIDLNTGTNSITLPSLPQGIYYLRTSDSSKVQKFVIIK